MQNQNKNKDCNQRFFFFFWEVMEGLLLISSDTALWTVWSLFRQLTIPP